MSFIEQYYAKWPCLDLFGIGQGSSGGSDLDIVTAQLAYHQKR